MKKFLFQFFFSYFVFISCCFGLTLPELTAEGAILIEPQTNTVLYAKNSNYTFYPASTTKILTSLILLEDLEETDTVHKTLESISNVPSDSSHIGLLQGDTYTVLDALYGILLSSDNYISYDMALYDADSIDTFAQKMNLLAKNIGATSSHFTNPHGYHDPMHYTTPYDLALLTKAAFSQPTLTKIAGTSNHIFSIHNRKVTLDLKHTSSLLDSASTYYNPHVIASKTGYHTPAGRVLVAKAVYDDIELIGVVMKDQAPYQFEDMNLLFEYGSKNFKTTLNEQGELHVVNTSYSLWAKEILEYATENDWIETTTKHFKSSISKRDWIQIAEKALPKESSFLASFIQKEYSPIYKENHPLTLFEACDIIYALSSDLAFNHLRFYPDEHFSCLSEATNGPSESLFFSLSNGIVSSPEQTLEDRPLTYEQSIALLHRFYKIYASRADLTF